VQSLCSFLLLLALSETAHVYCFRETAKAFSLLHLVPHKFFVVEEQWENNQLPQPVSTNPALTEDTAHDLAADHSLFSK
jgi:hypothetical protein